MELTKLLVVSLKSSGAERRNDLSLPHTFQIREQENFDYIDADFFMRVLAPQVKAIDMDLDVARGFYYLTANVDNLKGRKCVCRLYLNPFNVSIIGWRTKQRLQL